ncbi:hypothetical protein [Marivirga lumbricoides]
MKKHNVLPVIFGASLMLVIIFEEFLYRKIWVFEPILIAIIGIGSFFILLNSLMKKNWKNAIIISLSGLIAGTIYLPRTELLKSKPILKARLIDDLSSLSLTLREDKTFELVQETWMGTLEAFTGKYQIDGTRIIFLDEPYDNDFIPNTVDIYNDKIILNGDINKPDTSFAQFFDIQLNLLKNPDHKG